MFGTQLFQPQPSGTRTSEGRSLSDDFGLPEEGYKCPVMESKEDSLSTFEGPEQASLLDLEEEEEKDLDKVPRGTREDESQLSSPLLAHSVSGPKQAPESSHETRGTSQDWKVARVQPVTVSSPSSTQKPALCRSTSFTEKDLKEAKAQSQRIAAQLTTPPSSNSRGVLLFHRRRQRVNEFTFESFGKQGPKPISGNSPQTPPVETPDHVPDLRLNHSPQGSCPSPSSSLGVQAPEVGNPCCNMEGHGENANVLTQRSLEKAASEEEEIPLVVYLKENAALLTANGLHLSQSKETQKGPSLADTNALTMDVNQNPSLTETTPTTLVSDVNQNPPVMDVGQNTSVSITKQSVSDSQVQQDTPVADFKPSTLLVDEKTHSPGPDMSSTALITEVKPSIVPTNGKASPHSGQAIPSSTMNATVPDVKSSILVIDVKPSAPAVGLEMSGPAISTPALKQHSEVHLTLAKPQSVVNRTARPFGVQSQGINSQLERSPMMERRPMGERSPRTQAHTIGERSPQVQRHSVMMRSPMVERRPLRESSPTMERGPMVERPVMVERSPALEKRPVGHFTPPPTYAETLSTTPPVSRGRSPPSYSVLYPNTEHKQALLKGPGYGEGRSASATKTGILEESMARRGNRKSMFTFVEKPKVTPNPDLLDLVQTADEKRKQRDQGELGPEEEPFALGAEASNFQNEPPPRDWSSPTSEDALPEWSSCLKSPSIRAKPERKPNQNLTEATGKGAELYARRQSRMEKYVIESPGHAELARCPSPTMSLPPSWKYSNAPGFPGGFRVASRSPARTPPASLYHGYLPENRTPRREVEPTKQQPYQLQSSLFVLTPSKEPAKVPARAASPAKPGSLDLEPLGRLAPCPAGSVLPPSPALPRPARTSPGLSPSPVGPGGLVQDATQMSGSSPTFGGEVSPVSPSRAWSPRAKGQAPRPSFSTRNAGIEPQERWECHPASPPETPSSPRPASSLDGWVGRGPSEFCQMVTTSSPPPPPPMSPSWSERSLSPMQAEPRGNSRQMQALVARNIINAARRKTSSSPKSPGAEWLRPLSATQALPPASPRGLGSPCPPLKSPLTSSQAPFGDSPRPFLPASSSCSSPRNPGTTRPLAFRSPLPSPSPQVRSPAKPYTSRSPTDSDVSLDSEDSGVKSPSIRGYNICPRGWNGGSLRLKRGSLPSETSCTS
ncbi:synaptopodin isoform X1 [Petaurus breviceps papuanus]|uniref:synaptopodin isoform X1 n=1 Tax=Petaurus breviceps papuanus TaxID=3040969 RepID=UPI0036DB9D75